MGRLTDAWGVLRGRKAAVVPVAKSPSTPHRRSGRGQRSYEGAGLGRADSWLGDSMDANAEITRDLLRLRMRSRDLVQNNPYARRIVDALVNAIVATGIRPTVDTGDPALDAEVYRLWDAWGKTPVRGSTITAYGLQALMCRSMLVDGEALARIRPTYPTDVQLGTPPLRIQPIESDHLPVDLNKAVGLNRVVAGVEYDAVGEKVALHLYKEHPGSQGLWGMSASLETVRVPAESVIHAYRTERPGQVRGVPVLSPVILALWDLAGYEEAILVGTRAAATLVATVTGGSQDSPPDGIANEEDETGALATDGYGNPIEGLTPGTVIYAPDGKQVQIHTPQPPQGVQDFIVAHMRRLALGVGLSYHVLSGDMSDASFSQARLGLIEQSKNIAVWREQVFNPAVNTPLWRAFVDACVAAGLLPNMPALYDVRWSAPKQQSADRLEEAKAAVLEMQAGIRSRSEIIEADGRDPDVVNAEIADDKEERERLGIVSLGDLSQVSTSGVAQAIGNVLLSEPPLPGEEKTPKAA